MDDKGNGEKTLSQIFDEIYKDFKHLVNDTESTSSPSVQDHLYKTTKTLENITIDVSALDMFSKNENYQEMDPRHLKFILLPYMLGVLWQLGSREKRKEICQICKVYFTDFLERIILYDIIKGSSHVQVQVDDATDDGTDETKVHRKLTPEEKRTRKIHKFKENKELEDKIAAYKNFAAKYDEDDCSTYAKEINLAVIKRAANDSEDQLESIEMELKLIKFNEAKSEVDENAPLSTISQREPLQTFIITKDATQKAVYGMGYPALPILTVEELYQQRRETGEWGPPSSENQMPANPDDIDEAEARSKELLEEGDDQVELERKRRYDEYKDKHRRGWGNRFNRS